MVIKQKEHITPTTNSEANAVAKVHCKICDRGFLNSRGVSAHKRFCQGSKEAEAANPRKRRDQNLDALVKNTKRAALVAEEVKIKYNTIGLIMLTHSSILELNS